MRPNYDALDDIWEVVDDEGYVIRGPFESEDDAWDWIDAFGDDYE